MKQNFYSSSPAICSKKLYISALKKMVSCFKNNGASNSTGNIARCSRTHVSFGRWLRCWLAVLCSLTCVSLMAAYFVYVEPCTVLGENYTAYSCGMRKFPMHGNDPLPRSPPRLFTDEEIASRAVAREVLSYHSSVRPAGMHEFHFL